MTQLKALSRELQVKGFVTLYILQTFLENITIKGLVSVKSFVARITSKGLCYFVLQTFLASITIKGLLSFVKFVANITIKGLLSIKSFVTRITSKELCYFVL